MDQTKFLILGANGQLGKALQAHYPQATIADREELDITDQSSVDNFNWSAYTHIFNAAAYTNVDGAESEAGRKAAWSVNASAPARLAITANKHDVTLIHVSTDYVFDGTLQLHDELEGFAPLSIYGQSKAAGDLVVSTANKHYILRTSWVIGEGKNFVNIMVGLAEKGIAPTVVYDQVGRLTFTNELVRAIDHLITTNASVGTYNVSNSGESASWADITRKIFSLSGHENLTVTNTTTAEYYAGKSGIAPRPLQSTLNLAKIQSTGFVSTDWEDSLKNYLEDHTS